MLLRKQLLSDQRAGLESKLLVMSSSPSFLHWNMAMAIGAMFGAVAAILTQ